MPLHIAVLEIFHHFPSLIPIILDPANKLKFLNWKYILNITVGNEDNKERNLKSKGIQTELKAVHMQSRN